MSYKGNDLKDRLYRFYYIYQKDKLGDVDGLVALHKAQEAKLFEKLVEKYGKEPTIEEFEKAVNAASPAKSAAAKDSSVVGETAKSKLPESKENSSHSNYPSFDVGGAEDEYDTANMTFEQVYKLYLIKEADVLSILKSSSNTDAENFLINFDSIMHNKRKEDLFNGLNLARHLGNSHCLTVKAWIEQREQLSSANFRDKSKSTCDELDNESNMFESDPNSSSYESSRKRQYTERDRNGNHEDIVQVLSFGDAPLVAGEMNLENEIEMLSNHIYLSQAVIHGFTVIAEFSHTSAERLIELGAGKLLVQGMCLHEDNITVQEVGCFALNHLSHPNPEILEKLVSVGAGERIVRAMKNFRRDSIIQKQGCGVLSHFFQSENNIPFLLQIPGIIDEVQAAISGGTPYCVNQGNYILNRIREFNAQHPRSSKDEVPPLTSKISFSASSSLSNDLKVKLQHQPKKDPRDLFDMKNKFDQNDASCSTSSSYSSNMSIGGLCNTPMLENIFQSDGFKVIYVGGCNIGIEQEIHQKLMSTSIKNKENYKIYRAGKDCLDEVCNKCEGVHQNFKEKYKEFVHFHEAKNDYIIVLKGQGAQQASLIFPVQIVPQDQAREKEMACALHIAKFVFEEFWNPKSEEDVLSEIEKFKNSDNFTKVANNPADTFLAAFDRAHCALFAILITGFPNPEGYDDISKDLKSDVIKAAFQKTGFVVNDIDNIGEVWKETKDGIIKVAIIKNPSHFELRYLMFRNLSQHFTEHDSQVIFCGHGTSDGFVFKEGIVSGDVFRGYLVGAQPTRNICIALNCCFSLQIASNILSWDQNKVFSSLNSLLVTVDPHFESRNSIKWELCKQDLPRIMMDLKAILCENETNRTKSTENEICSLDQLIHIVSELESFTDGSIIISTLQKLAGNISDQKVSTQVAEKVDMILKEVTISNYEKIEMIIQVLQKDTKEDACALDSLLKNMHTDRTLLAIDSVVVWPLSIGKLDGMGMLQSFLKCKTLSGY